MYTKYQYWTSTHFFKKYLSTPSTFISSTSTSTSTHIKICSKDKMDIQSRVNFGWTKQKVFPQIMSLLKSQLRWSYSMQSRFWIDKIKGLSPNHVFVKKSRWPYSMQSNFGMDKIQASYKLEWLYGIRIYFHII